MKEKRRSGLASAMMVAMAMGVVSRGYQSGVNVVLNGVSRKHSPWDHIQLSKAERRGKTAEEIDALRRAKWKAATSAEVEARVKEAGS